MADGGRIVRFVCYRLDTPAGIERAFAALAPFLAEYHQLELIVLRGEISPTLETVRQVSAHIQLVRLHPIRLLRACRSAPRADVEIIVGIWAGMLWPPLWLARSSSRRIIWEHSLEGTRFEHDRRLRRLRVIVWSVLRRCSMVVSVSKSSADYVRHELGAGRRRYGQPARVTVIPNVVCDARPSPAVPQRVVGTQLVSIGALTTLKNTILAVRAMAHLPVTHHLTCVGSGPEREALEREIDALSLRSRIRMAGFVDDVTAFLDGADVLVHPSLSETFCLVAFEAAIRDVPVACLAVGGLVGVVPESVVGCTAPPDASAEQFAYTIQAALSVRHQPRAFASAAERRRQMLAPEVIVGKWNDLIDGVAVDAEA